MTNQSLPASSQRWGSGFSIRPQWGNLGLIHSRSLKPSHVFSSQDLERWRLVEPSTGRNICYLLPGKVDAEVLKSNQGKIVSLSGPAVFDLRAHLDLVVVNNIQGDGGGAEEK